MEEKNDSEKLDEVMLPGFRFHPTDEELVGFYLKRKIQQRPLSIELIKQLDIYKYDPWDLPKLASTGEKEWYFYCPRDRKYRNSARPNRVTGAGFWKATGTDRPIYSSEGSKCIGLKKSLVFYKGRAAKGVKTDWMMHEFRLPSLSDSSSSSPKKFSERTIPANDSWAICRIFKKTNSTAQRALSHSWVSPLPHREMNTSEMLTKDDDTSKFFSDHSNNISSLLTKKSSLPNQFCTNQNHPSLSSTTTTSTCPLDIASYKPILNPFLFYKPFDQLPIISSSNNNSDLMFSSSLPLEPCSANAKATATVDISSMLLSMSSSPPFLGGDFSIKASSEAAHFGGFQEQQYSTNNTTGYSSSLALPVIQDGNGLVKMMNHPSTNLNMNVVIPRVMEDPDHQMNMHEAWKSNLLWDSSSCPCDHVPSTYSTTTKCYT